MKLTRYFLCFLLVSVIATSCQKETEKEKIETDPIEFTKEGILRILKPDGQVVKELDIEIADNDYERETGLMSRERMEENQAMLFIFDNSAPRFFYMKNTLISLDIIYFDSNKTAVSFQKNAVPKDLTPLPSDAPAQYVLEINAGLSEEWNLEIGDRIEFVILGE